MCINALRSEHHKEKRRKRANTWYKSSEEVGNGPDKMTCRTRYQQTPVEVYARFIAVDQVHFALSFTLFLFKPTEKQLVNTNLLMVFCSILDV